MSESKPIRWRRATFSDAGSRWDTGMNRAVWTRDHGSDMEAWRGLPSDEPGEVEA